ncbi:MAG: LCP family protein [Chloroflexota bacterium]
MPPDPDARSTAPDTPPGGWAPASEGRRLLAAALSALVPGLGQAYEGRLAAAALLFAPVVLIAVGLGLIVGTTPLPELAGSLVLPSTITVLLVANIALLAWRILAVVDAWHGGRRQRAERTTGSTGRDRGTAGALGVLALVAILAFVSVPHALAGWYGASASTAVARIFTAEDGDPFDLPAGTPGATLAADANAIVDAPALPSPEPTGSRSPIASATPAPSPSPSTSPTPTPLDARVNILLLGFDSGPGRAQTLTDTMMVVSLDPVGRTVSMISVPRDTVNVPLGDGHVFGPKLNSLIGFAQRNPGAFGDRSPIRVLKDALGELLGIKIRYYASVDLPGFVKVIDAIGGVGVYVKEALNDGHYREYGFNGFSIDAGCHHLDGISALAFARIRYSIGQNDFTRAGRQQQVLVAARDQVVREGLLLDIPRLLDALGSTVRTDIPPELVPRLAEYASGIDQHDVAQAVITWPLVASGMNGYGSVLLPDLAAIRLVADGLFTQPGTAPVGWPAPTPTPTTASGKAKQPPPVCP